MEDDDAELRKEQGRRLAEARAAAHFKSAREAALKCGWPESTYRAHENGSRTIGQNDATKYIKKFISLGARGVTAKSILFGSDEERSLDRMIKNQPAHIQEKAYRAVRDLLKK